MTPSQTTQQKGTTRPKVSLIYVTNNTLHRPTPLEVGSIFCCLEVICVGIVAPSRQQRVVPLAKLVFIYIFLITDGGSIF